jgi:Domain of unknown function (DUF4234)
MTDAPPPAAPDPSAVPAAAVPVPAAGGGAVGTPRAPATVILLSIVTFGIYFWYWAYKQFDDLQKFRGEGVGGTIGLIVTILVGIVTPFLLANETQKLRAETGQPETVTTMTGLWILLPFVGFFVWLFKNQNAINEVWVANGATAV